MLTSKKGINIPNLFSGKENIKIYDLLGKEVISKAININSASIDLTNLKDAIYIVNVKSRNSRTSTFKIVKN